jgi:hypothetical protein
MLNKTCYIIILSFVLVLSGCNTSRNLQITEKNTKTEDKSTSVNDSFLKDRSVITTEETIDTSTVIPGDSMIVKNRIGIPFHVSQDGRTIDITYAKDSVITVKVVIPDEVVKIAGRKKTTENKIVDSQSSTIVNNDITVSGQETQKSVQAKKANWSLYIIVGVTILIALIIILAFLFIKSKI